MSSSVRRELAAERALERSKNTTDLAPIAHKADLNEQTAAVATAAEEDNVIDISQIGSWGIAEADVMRLKAAGLLTAAGIFMKTKKELLMITGMTETRLDQVLRVCKYLNRSKDFVSGVDLLGQRRKTIVRITTGSRSLDTLLRGGIETAAITEAFGEFRTGKTQLAHMLCVTAQLPKLAGGGNGRVVFIDTEGTFRPERVMPMAARFGLDPMRVLDNIAYSRPFNSDTQASLIASVASRMVEDPYALLIIDSVTSLFRADFVGREELVARQQAIGQLMSSLSKLASEFNIAVFVTNQVYSDPGKHPLFRDTAIPNEETNKPIGGNVLAHASTTRLSFRKGRGEERICRVADSPCIPESEAAFRITLRGIEDVDESDGEDL